ncbi:unnamed protein product [Adineta ricciae]|uniref:Enhancer of mRNA-decapping protein 4 C-terminal domain-containing protein n=1 Tax=Adineta ricciae TaxID=249248 RepID=A0A815EHL0_ADIRI|nr:unnamed protein product [Adineta ricciae]CAF1312595.1 unnamed protein product [Adineta ricciae]
MAHPPYNIDDLLTPNSSLTNVTSLPNGDTTRSLLAGHDGLTTNINNTTHTLSPSASVNNTLPTIDPLHALLLGNTTAFDAVTTQQPERCAHISPSQQQVNAINPATQINDLFQIKATTEKDSSSLLINDISQSPFDQDDKEVAESMSCSANYPLQFEAIPDDEDDNDGGDAVFMPIKSNDDDEPMNDNQDPLLLPSTYGDNSLWSKSCHSNGASPMKGLKTSGRQVIDDFSDPTETSDKDDDSTADEEDLLHSRIKRRTGRSPNSSQIPLNIDALHAIRELTHQLNEYRTHGVHLAAESLSQATFQSEYDEKLERCCQRLEQLTTKVDRLISFEQTGVVSRPNRPSPNTAQMDIIATNEPHVTLADAHYDRLEAMLIEKIETYVQGAMKSVFEPYRDLKDNLHKDLTAKLLATDTVIKQTITQIFRSKTMIDSLSHAVANAIQATMISSYRDTFNQIVIPSFEKAATNMFQQTNEVFKRGTKEYLQEMIEYGRQQQRSLIQQREQMMAEIRKESTQLLKEFEKKNQELTATLKTEVIQYMTTNLTPLIHETMQTIIRDEMNVVLRELLITQKNEINALIIQHLRQQSATPKLPATTTTVASRTTTPLPAVASSNPTTIDTKQQTVLKLVRAGQLNQAFEYVLTASDLNLVLYLCENVRPAELFSIQPCPLQIPVILSLIQQLAADLTTHQELKYSYLHEALVCLDLSHPSVRDYLYNVLADLNKKLYAHIQTNPTAPMSKRFQLLYMASQGLVQKIVQQRTTPANQILSSTLK